MRAALESSRGSVLGAKVAESFRDSSSKALFRSIIGRDTHAVVERLYVCVRVISNANSLLVYGSNARGARLTMRFPIALTYAHHARVPSFKKRVSMALVCYPARPLNAEPRAL